MKKIPLSCSLLTFLEELEYTEAALAADPETSDLAAPFTEEIAGWSDVFARERVARRAVVRADAVVAVRDGQLDRHTTRFGGLALVEGGQDRKGAFFRKFFPVAPSAFIQQALRKQCERTRDVIVPEIKKLPEESPLRPFASLLLAASKAALTALDARAKVKGERAAVGSDVVEWKEGVNRLRATTHAELLKLAAEKRYPKTWADTFFRAEESAAVEEDEPSPPDPSPPTPPTPPDA